MCTLFTWVHGSEEDIRVPLRVLVGHDDLLPLVLRVNHGSVEGALLGLEVAQVQLLGQHTPGGDDDDTGVAGLLDGRQEALRQQVRPHCVGGEVFLQAVFGFLGKNFGYNVMSHHSLNKHKRLAYKAIIS